jgi:hypothetical protein
MAVNPLMVAVDEAAEKSPYLLQKDGSQESVYLKDPSLPRQKPQSPAYEGHYASVVHKSKSDVV